LISTEQGIINTQSYASRDQSASQKIVSVEYLKRYSNATAFLIIAVRKHKRYA
jgi:hypothetical protein